uniref:Transmembrane protein n=1 Tax=Polysiphonia sp. TaxID=1967842 RepID=A0A1Z1M3U2_9FLOR|nr:hypothetical protein [Polysiphonia sp.]
MHFLYYISSTNYITLKTKLLKKKYLYLRITCILGLLIIIPYISSKILIMIVLLIEFCIMLILKNFYLTKITQAINNIFVFSIYNIIINYFINYNYCTNNNLIISYVQINYLFQVILFYCTKQIICKFCFYFIIYEIPQYMKKIIFLNTVYLLLLNDLLTFIRSEIINQTLLMAYTKLHQLKQEIFIINKLSLFISTQIVEHIIESINNFYLAIKIKNDVSIISLINYFLLYSNKPFNKLLQKQNNLNITLWSKNLQNKLNQEKYI